MIRVTRLNGEPFVINSDLIERLDARPDTVVTLVDGTKYVIRETPDDVIRDVQMYHAEILSWATHIGNKTMLGDQQRGGLSVVPSASEEN